MLDAVLVLQDVEELLDVHYTEFRTQLQRQVRVYQTTPQPPVVQPPHHQPPAQPPALPQKSGNSFNELVANVFVLLMLSVLNTKLSNQPAR